MNTTKTNARRLLGTLAGTLLIGTLAACGSEGSPAAPAPAAPPDDALANQYVAPFPGCGLTADQVDRIRAGKVRPQCTGQDQWGVETPSPRPPRVLGHL
jgi:hypothetical protein